MAMSSPKQTRKFALMTVSVEPAQLRELDQLAARSQRTRSASVRLLLAAAIKSNAGDLLAPVDGDAHS